MAGLSAAWRLSEPGWRDRFDSITVYQRGWRLGGKGASSRGPNGRIEEHGLHIWLGSYENAFGMLRECYAELDRATTRSRRADPDVGPGADSRRTIWAWPTGSARLADVAGHLHPQRRAARRAGRHRSRDDGGRVHPSRHSTRARLRRLSARAQRPSGLALSTSAEPAPTARMDRRSRSVPRRAALLALADPEPPRPALDRDDRQRARGHARRTRLRAPPRPPPVVATAVADDRGDPWNPRRQPGHRSARLPRDQRRGLRRMDACATARTRTCWTSRWCAACTTWCSATRMPTLSGPPSVRGKRYSSPALALFQYKGAIFWKMTAGMGDIVIAPHLPGAAQARGRVRILPSRRRAAPR